MPTPKKVNGNPPWTRSSFLVLRGIPGYWREGPGQTSFWRHGLPFGQGDEFATKVGQKTEQADGAFRFLANAAVISSTDPREVRRKDRLQGIEASRGAELDEDRGGTLFKPYPPQIEHSMRLRTDAGTRRHSTGTMETGREPDLNSVRFS